MMICKVLWVDLLIRIHTKFLLYFFWHFYNFLCILKFVGILENIQSKMEIWKRDSSIAGQFLAHGLGPADAVAYRPG
jgi:hypothetical protein